MRHFTASLSLLLTACLQVGLSQTLDQSHLMSKKIVETPKLSTHNLVRASGSASQNAERAIYALTFQSNRQVNIALVAFRDDQTKQFWVGRSHEFYVSTGSGIIGFTAIPGGIQWSRPLLSIGTNVTDVKEIWKSVDDDITPEMLASITPQLDFKGVLGEAFFLRDPSSMAPGVPRIDSVNISNGTHIQLDLSSPGGHYHAKCSFDVRTLTLNSAFLDGRQAFPK